MSAPLAPLPAGSLFEREASLFDTVPEGVLQNVLRLTSDFPSLKFWRLGLDPSSIATLLTVSGSWNTILDSLDSTLALGVPGTSFAFGYQPSFDGGDIWVFLTRKVSSRIAMNVCTMLYTGARTQLPFYLSI